MSDHSTQSTSLTAFEELREEDEDVSLRKQVAAEIEAQPATNEELYHRIEDRSRSSIRPRVNELVRMGCVKREGTRETASGNDAYVHHITDKGRDYLEGEIDPDPLPPLSQVQTKVVQIARQVVYGSTDQETLESAVLKHDALKRRRDPDWSPPEVEADYLADEIPEHVDPKDNSESDEGGDDARSSEPAPDVTDADDDGLTDEQREISTTVGHTDDTETDVYIGRGPDGAAMGEVPIGDRGWLGNPYPKDEYGREECIELFREDFEDRIETDADFADAVESLHGDALGCWCRGIDEDAPACHGDVIAEWVDRLGGGELRPLSDAADDAGDTADAEAPGDPDQPADDTTEPDESTECAGCGRPVDTAEAESIKFIDGTTAHLCSVCYDEFNQDGM